MDECRLRDSLHTGQVTMRRMMVQYTVKAGRGDENQGYIERVFAELASAMPQGLRYASFRLDDGVSFVHVVSHESEDDTDQLRALPCLLA